MKLARRAGSTSARRALVQQLRACLQYYTIQMTRLPGHQASSTSARRALVEPASSCKRGITDWFLRATAVPAGTAEARSTCSYGDSVCLSVRPSQPGAEPSPGEIETSGLHHTVAWSI